ncbi:MAG: DUF4982 domain-containing protein [Bacteroidaceae bacterium]|nr:DUF4982 domain-containing protein [Bacteroidaceae bacterium]
MKRFAFLISTFFIGMNVFGQRVLLDDGWQFRLDGQDEWRAVTLPHDWSIEGSFSEQAPSGNDGGYLPTGLGWYRRILQKDKSRHMRLHFEGVYMNSEVRLNGQRVGGHPYGYVPFVTQDLVPLMKEGENLLEVRVDNSQQKNCRWYSGSGIYRHVWLERYDDLHLVPFGIGITTAEVSMGHATVRADIELENISSTPKEGVLRMRFDEVDGTVNCKVNLPAHGKMTAPLTLSMSDVEMWNPEHPNLYHATIELVVDGHIVETSRQQFGIRTISYSAEEGFLLNDKPVLFNGACLHHDNGPLGAAALDAAEIHRVRLMKEAGFNAVRTSHNPSSEAFLAACDSIGLMVIDEAFDGWRDQKNPYDYHLLFDEWSAQDATTMVRRDRNHPSVVAWSIGNEIIERKSEGAVRDAHRLAEAIRATDPSRPITQALAAWDSDWDIYDPLAAEHDIVGYNYMLHKHEGDHQRVPNRVIWQTESYPRDAFKNWATVQDHPYVIGDFVWTGLDYIGESGIGRYYYDGQTPGEHYQRNQWPYHGAYCGDVDITGWRKPISHYRSMLWNPEGEHLYMAVREPNGYKGRIRETSWSVWPTWESWNWPGWEGREIEVEVTSHQPVVRLYLNFFLVGEQRVSRETGFQAVFRIPYKPGILKAESVDEMGNICESRTMTTAGEPYAIRATADRTHLKADGQDLAFVTLEVVDNAGRPCPWADNLLTVSTKGGATLEALCNADWRDLDSMRDAEHHTWKGRAMAIVRAGKKKGKATLVVSSPGLKKTSLLIYLQDN